MARTGAARSTRATRLSIDRRLGGTGERCHEIELTPARVRKKVRYQDKMANGSILNVGPKHHKMIQMYSGQAVDLIGELTRKDDSTHIYY